MTAAIPAGPLAYSTSQLAAAVGYSVQQVRDLERLAVIPPAYRKPNGYRHFGPEHVTALRAYRQLAIAIGPVAARSTMRELRTLPYDQAIARIVALHVELARSREHCVAAIDALDRIVEEEAHEASATPADSMSITELANAIGVRSSALRYWEGQGLVSLKRTAGTTRLYPLASIREARIVAALRAGGYRVPEVRTVMESLRTVRDAADARSALQGRLHTVAIQSEALIRAGADIADLVSR